MSNCVHDPFFIYVKDFISKDKNYCNYARYMDYWTYNSNRKKYETTNCVLNEGINVTSWINWIPKIDSKFIEYYYREGQDSNVVVENYGSETVFRLNDICLKFINLNYEYKIKGSSLTALDFLYKSKCKTDATSDNIFRYIRDEIFKIITVGDKNYVAAIIVKDGRCFVSLKNMESIFEENKDVFNLILNRLLYIINNYSCRVTNLKFQQFIANQLEYPICKKISIDTTFNGPDGDGFENFETFTFDVKERESKDYIKENIINIIRKQTIKYIESYSPISDVSIYHILSCMREKMERLYEKRLGDSFISGVTLNNLMNMCGWKCFNHKVDTANIFLDKYKNYIYKDVDIVPKIAIVGSRMRILNSDGVRKITSYYRFHVTRLYFCLDTNTMLCEGRHPNVSSSHQVCMGDIAGKIILSKETDPDKITNMLKQCEDLLKSINYNSSYTREASGYYENDDYSMNYNECKIDETTGEAVRIEKMEDYQDSQTVGDDDFEEESTTENPAQIMISQDIQAQIVDTIIQQQNTQLSSDGVHSAEEVESGDFEEISDGQ